MLHIAKIDACLKILTDNEVKIKNVGKYFKSTFEKLCSNLNENRILKNLLNNTLYLCSNA